MSDLAAYLQSYEDTKYEVDGNSIRLGELRNKLLAEGATQADIAAAEQRANEKLAETRRQIQVSRDLR